MSFIEITYKVTKPKERIITETVNTEYIISFWDEDGKAVARVWFGVGKAENVLLEESYTDFKKRLQDLK